MEEKAPVLVIRKGYRRSANSAENCGIVCRKVKAEKYRKQLRGELSYDI